MSKASIRSCDFKNKTVLIRVDFNVPIDSEGNITDDTRIKASIPTIELVRNSGAVVVLTSHLGRPDGTRSIKLSMEKVAKRLSTLLGIDVIFLGDCVGEEVERRIKDAKAKDVIMLENVRFHLEEEENDESFAKELAKLADVYVNDAFGSAHRAHASTEGVAHYLPAYAGLLMEKELHMLGDALSEPKRPFVAIMGGAKVKDKLGVIENLLNKVDSLLIAGGMAYTFLKAKGLNIGNSLLDESKVDFANDMINLAKKNGVDLLLPVDCMVATEFSKDCDHKVVNADDIEDGWMGLDIGPKTIELFVEKIMEAGTVVWNGPVGAFEMEPYSKGTFSVAKAMSESKAITIVGGGDSAFAVEKFGLGEKMSHVSTGGGASLEFLEGIKLPGVQVLNEE